MRESCSSLSAVRRTWGRIVGRSGGHNMEDAGASKTWHSAAERRDEDKEDSGNLPKV